MTEIEYSLRSAKEPDASKVATLVEAAYSHYVERIGILPRPMTDDYAQFIANQQVTVAESHGSIVVGVIVLNVDEEGFLIDNVAVDPSHDGEGLKRLSSSLRKPKLARGVQFHLSVHSREDI